MNQYDLVIIGGGINGLWSAYVAHAQGLKVALYEKNDFASGTSGKSTQLIHGGLRYLEYGELKLVYESLHERTWLLKNFNDVVKPLALFIPLFINKPVTAVKYFIGLWLYYFLALGHSPLPKFKSVKALKKDNPNFETRGLWGALEYFDAQTNDRALCLKLAQELSACGVEMKNYHEVTAVSEQSPFEIKIFDLFKKQSFVVSAKVLLSAKGPWEDKKWLRPTKGVHLFFPRFTDQRGYLLTASDKRVFFVLPYADKTLVGTTDTHYESAPDAVSTSEADKNYLVEQTSRYFPLVKSLKILSSYAGIRPLMKTHAKTNAKASRRDFLIEENAHFHMVGGKLTTGRAFAVRTVGQIVKKYFKEKKMNKMNWHFQNRSQDEFFMAKTLSDYYLRRTNLGYFAGENLEKMVKEQKNQLVQKLNLSEDQFQEQFEKLKKEVGIDV